MTTVGTVVLVWAILSIPVAVLTGKFIRGIDNGSPLPPPRPHKYDHEPHCSVNSTGARHDQPE